MRPAGLRARAVRGFRAKVNIHRLFARHPNRLWDLSVTRVNQVRVGDITFLKVDRGWQWRPTRLWRSTGIDAHAHSDERCGLDVYVAVPFPGAPRGNQPLWYRGWRAGLK